MHKINRLKNILICPTAGDKLIYKKKNFYSNKSKKIYKIKDDKIFFSKNVAKINKFVIIKNYIKNKHSNLYYNLLKIFGPTYPYPIDREIKKVINLDDDKLICLDIGSGNLQTNKNFINLDYHPYENINLVCDASNIPIKANSINFVYSKSFLEHAKNPKQVVNEIYRVLKPKSLTIHSIPFLYPIHASPFDYNRYTDEGLKILFKKFKILKIVNISGPFSLINIILLEIISNLFSLINKKLGTLSYVFFMFLLSPIKYLDFFFVKRKVFKSIATNFLIIAKKN